MSKFKHRKDPKTGRVLPDGITYRRSDDRYLYRYQRYNKTHYLYDEDLDELKKKIIELQIGLSQGLNTSISKMSLNQYYPTYLETYKHGKIKEASYQNKISYFEKHMKPYDIACVPMKEISRQMVVSHFQYLADEKQLAYGTIKSIASAMKCAVQEVVSDRGMLTNPFEDVMQYIDAKKPVKVEALEKDVQKELMDFLQKPGFQSVYLPLIGTLLGTGMRFGEAMALTFDDIDWEKKIIKVYKTLNYKDRGNGKKEFFITTPKTENAYREIPLSSQVLGLLRMQKQYVSDMHIRQDFVVPEYDMRGRNIREYKGFVFTTKLGKPYSDGLASVIKRIVKKHNEEELVLAEKEEREPFLLPVFHAHQLRHTFCTRLIEDQLKKGITNYQSVQYLMGHAKISTTIDIYTSVSKAIKQTFAADIEEIDIYQ